MFSIVKRNPIIIKTNDQIEGIRRSCRFTAQALDMLDDRIKPGITTDQINKWIHEYILDHGAWPATLNYRKYPKSICTSLNNVVCHGIPDGTVLKDGDILNVDVASVLNGYFGDSSRMYGVGEVSEKAERLVRVAAECLYAGINEVKPLNRIGDIGYAIQRHAESRGYSVVRNFGGHGTGLKFHEEPIIPHFGKSGSGEVLRPNMVFTIEPMINAGGADNKTLANGWTAVTLDGSLSAQWEHTVRVTPTGVEILTA